MIHIGCTGWDFDHWEGSFYPRGIEDRLKFFSKIASFTELRTTYNRLPTEDEVLNWYSSSPDNFIFVARMNKKITYNSDMEIDEKFIERYFEALKPLDNKLQMVLLHFPMKFQKGKNSFDFLKELTEVISSYFSGQILVEAPNRSWQKIEVRNELKEKSACLVGNDRRPIPALMRDPDVYYLRLLGDKRTVPRSEFGENPLDRDDDIKYWAEHLQFLDKKQKSIFVSIDNHFSGSSIEDAYLLAKWLRKLNIKSKGFKQTPKQTQ